MKAFPKQRIVVAAIGALMAVAVSMSAAGRDKGRLDRTVLPIPEPKRPLYSEIDARKAKAPPRFQVKAPAGAPNVVIVLIDDMGFGVPSTFGGPVGMPTILARSDLDGRAVRRGVDSGLDRGVFRLLLLADSQDRLLGGTAASSAKAALSWIKTRKADRNSPKARDCGKRGFVGSWNDALSDCPPLEFWSAAIHRRFFSVRQFGPFHGKRR